MCVGALGRADVLGLWSHVFQLPVCLESCWSAAWSGALRRGGKEGKQKRRKTTRKKESRPNWKAGMTGAGEDGKERKEVRAETGKTGTGFFCVLVFVLYFFCFKVLFFC